MDVRVCGPNLRDQSKGQFHVHRDGCMDLRKYGPGRPLGGDCPGSQEMLVKDATLLSVVEATMPDQLLEAAQDEGRSELEIADEWLSDFHFAPCCKELEHGGPPLPAFDPESKQAEDQLARIEADLHEVYECWVHGQSGSFEKFTDLSELDKWFRNVMLTNGVGAHIHVAIHSSNEYKSSPKSKSVLVSAGRAYRIVDGKPVDVYTGEELEL